MRHEFLPTFKIAAIFLPLFLSSKDKKTKLVVDKEKKEKNPKCEGFFVFGHFFEAQNEASPNDLRAYVLAEVGAVIRERGEGRQKRDIETQRELVMGQKGTQIMG